MEGSLGWSLVLLGTVVALAIVAGVLLVRTMPRRGEVSREERNELATAPMPALQKRAVWGLLVSVATLAITTGIVSRYGAAEYWDNDSLRLTVMAIFIGGLFAYVLILLIAVAKQKSEGSLDERDRLILSQASGAQSAMVLLTLVAWVIYLAEKFRDAGAVPVVYLYLIFGCVVIVNIIGQAVGILLGYWRLARYGQG
jgi:hypothetical protein